MEICVYCSSKENIEKIYGEVAKELGELIGKKKHNLVYGGANLGLMKMVAEATKENKGNVTGVLPEVFKHLAWNEETLLVENLRHRNAEMEKRSNAFVILPGGLGTLYEIFDIIVAKQVGEHNKPIVILNTKNFYKNLLAHLDSVFQNKFAEEDHREFYHVVNTPEEAIDYIESYKVSSAT